MMMVIGARRARCRQTRYRRGGVCTLLVDAPLLLLMIVGRCKGARLSSNSVYISCKNNPSTCTELNLSDDLSGTIPTELGTCTALTYL